MVHRERRIAAKEIQIMQNRRDFLKLLGLAAGSTIVGCGTSKESGMLVGLNASSVPNAYQFTPVVTSGATLPNRRSIRAQAADGGPPFVGAVMVNDLRHICFHANDEADHGGVYEIDYDGDGSTSEIQIVVEEGQVLPDGTVVDMISPGDLNNNDDTVFVVEDPQGRKTVQYSKDRAPFDRLCTAYQDLSDEARLCGEFHPELCLTSSGDLMFCCAYRNEDGNLEGEGLFYVPNETTSRTRRVLSRNQLLSGTSSAIKTFGIFDVRSGGSYLCHGSAEVLQDESGNGEQMTYLVRGRVGEEPETLVATPGLGDSNAIPGSVFMGPRLSDADYGAIVQSDRDKTAFWLSGKKLLDADFKLGGSTTPRGAKIISMFPPVFGPDGLVFIQVFTFQGTEILVHDGQRFSTVLASGDIINGRTLGMIVFGALPHCVNSLGDLVCVADFTDGGSSILLGRAI
jgi:hypothetical protein